MERATSSLGFAQDVPVDEVHDIAQDVTQEATCTGTAAGAWSATGEEAWEAELTALRSYRLSHMLGVELLPRIRNWEDLIF
ncbi:hypothetical protein [Streptomyces echinatus]|uniref:hypothetical protein n=1 Tax=Streptomyces echinatus TaxID=67293 RepID=UPI003806B8C5